MNGAYLQVESSVRTAVVERRNVARVWEALLPWVERYREKSPHPVPSSHQLLLDLSTEGGDELMVVTEDGKFAGFFTFKVQELMEGEVWGTVAMICFTPEAQESGVLPQAAEQLESLLRARGATVMNYMTSRKGFEKLAPRLGFRQRIVEWMKEL